MDNYESHEVPNIGITLDKIIQVALNMGNLTEYGYKELMRKRLDDIYICGEVRIDSNNPHVYIDPMIDFTPYYHSDDRLVKYKPNAYCSLKTLKEWLGYYSKYKPKYSVKLIKILIK